MDSTTKTKTKKKCSALSSLKKNQEKKLNCIDPLKELKDTSQYNLDEKIKFLKSELKVLVKHTKKNEENNDVSVPDIQCSLNLCDTLEDTDSNFKSNISKTLCEKTEPGDDLLILEENTLNRNNVTSPNGTLLLESTRKGSQSPPLKPCQSSSKFSEWLSKTIDIIDATITKSPQNNKCNVNDDLDAICKKNLDLSGESSKLCSLNGNGVRNQFTLSQNNIESLLYKSFVLQSKNLNTDDSVVEIIKTPKWKYKTRWSYINSNKKVPQRKHNLNLLSRNRKRKRKRKSKESKNAEINYNSHNSDVEIIPVSESSSAVEFSELSDTSMDCLALAAEDINWDEPFESDNHNISSQSSVVEIKEAHYEETNEGSYVNKAEGNKNMETDTERNEKKTEQIGRNWECPICLEGYSGQEVVTTLCGHVFCKECIQNYNMTTSKSCPSCRTNLSDKPLITLFNF